jgi:hypothetical protein
LRIFVDPPRPANTRPQPAVEGKGTTALCAVLNAAIRCALPVNLRGGTASCLPPLLMVYAAAALTLRNSKVATFNKVFSTRRLLQIIVVLGATVILKLLS